MLRRLADLLYPIHDPEPQDDRSIKTRRLARLLVQAGKTTERAERALAMWMRLDSERRRDQ